LGWGKGDGTWIFVNGYMVGIGLWVGDLWIGCGEVLWISGEGVGICWWDGLWKSDGSVVGWRVWGHEGCVVWGWRGLVGCVGGERGGWGCFGGWCRSVFGEIWGVDFAVSV
jgi:hypothetical protein